MFFFYIKIQFVVLLLWLDMRRECTGERIIKATNCLEFIDNSCISFTTEVPSILRVCV